MTDNLHIPRRLEGEQEVNLNPVWSKRQVTSIEQVSLNTVIQVLIKRGFCTEADLIAEEARQRAVEQPRDPMPAMHFSPVQTHSERQVHRHRREDSNRIRRWASKRHWSRKLGTLIFGWKWHRKKNELET